MTGCKNDPNTISNKIFDFSYGTLNHLRKAGYMDAIYHLDRQIAEESLRIGDNASTIKPSST